ncbi:SIR2 family NAD-dependent protein deacylase, partial [Vibrio harveyi]
MKKEHELFIQRFVEELEEKNVAVFAGAGLSSSAGYVNWKELIRPLADELELNVDNEYDLVGVAQYYLNENGRYRISQQLMDEIASAKNPTNNHNILARLPIRTYWTTNYDKLIEKSLESNGKIVDVKYTNNHLALTKKRRDAVIYKMHGDIDHPDTAILTKDDYEKYSVKNAPYITALSGDLVSKTFLFLGFSFTDPNLDYIMSRVRAYFEDHQRQHYCIFKECSVNDFENVEEFQNAVIKQKLLIKDLQRFRVKTLLVEKYEDITLI